MMFKGPRMECGRNAGANSGTAMPPRTGSLAGLLVLAICLRPLRPGAFVGSHARLAITGLVARDLKVAFLLAALCSFHSSVHGGLFMWESSLCCSLLFPGACRYDPGSFQ